MVLCDQVMYGGNLRFTWDLGTTSPLIGLYMHAMKSFTYKEGVKEWMVGGGGEVGGGMECRKGRGGERRGREERDGGEGEGASIALSSLDSPGTKDVGAPPMPTSTGPAPGMVVVKATGE